MKTKLFFSLVLSVALMSVTTWTKAQTLELQTNGLIAGHTYDTAVCLTLYNSVCLHKANWQLNNLRIEKTGYYLGIGDTSKLIAPGEEGAWKIKSDEGNFTINIWFVNPPITPFATPSTTLCGNWDAQPNAEPLTKYLWSTTETTQSINIINPGIYSVTVSSGAQGCGSISDAIDVLWSEPVPSLIGGGPYCAGVDTLQGNPCYTHQYANYNWSTGQSGPTANQISLYATGTYSVTVTNANGCKMSASTSLVFNPPVSIEMCFVTFDTISWKNKIVWYVDPTQTDIDSVRVEVKNQIGQWISIGTVLYADGSLIHMGSNPQQDFNEYRIVSIGHCGKGPNSQIHRSIWLSTFSNELQWQNYYGTFIPPYYVVFALMNTNAVIPVDTIPSCSGAGCINHSPIVTNPNVVKYFVAFQENCSSNKSNVWVRSNYWDILTSTEEVQKEDPLTIYPNPTTTGEIQITGPVGNYQIEVYNIDGKKVIKTRNIKNIDIGEFPNGLYFIKITTDSRTYTEKVVKL